MICFVLLSFYTYNVCNSFSLSIFHGNFVQILIVCVCRKKKTERNKTKIFWIILNQRALRRTVTTLGNESDVFVFPSEIDNRVHTLALGGELQIVNDILELFLKTKILRRGTWDQTYICSGIGKKSDWKYEFKDKHKI